MVVSRLGAKEGFAKRFNEALDELPLSEECPRSHPDGRGRAAWVARRYKISNEGAAKWLDGRVIPDQTNIARVAQDLGVTPQWLHSNQLPKRPAFLDDISNRMCEVWKQIHDPGARKEVLDFARYKAGLPPDPMEAMERRSTR